jgi:prephenate dehydrogenase
MANISIAILGLGRVGASLALALRRYNGTKGQHQFVITGYDNRPGVVKPAEKMKVVDQLANRAHSAVQDKDIVVIALAYAEVPATYDLIAPDLREGVVVLDMSPLKLPSLEWAKKYLPKEAHMVGITPVVNPKYLFEGVDDTENAREDLFDKGSMLLMPSPSCAKEAVELATDFSTLLGATPHFVDPGEHDGLIAATEGLPALLGVVAFYTFFKGAGWTDGQRMVNPAFGMLTHHLYDTHPDDLRDLWLNNRENLVRYLDDVIANLRNFRGVLAENNQAGVEAAVIETVEAYEKWINRRHNARWEESARQEMPGGMSDMARGLMGGYLMDKLSGKKKSDE